MKIDLNSISKPAPRVTKNQFWVVRGYLREGYDYLNSLLQASETFDEGNHAVRAKALRVLSMMARRLLDFETAEMHGLASLAIYESLNDTQSIGYVCHNLALIYFHQHVAYEVARKYMKRSHDAFRASHHITGLIYVHSDLGEIEFQAKKFEEAKRLWTEGLRMAKEVQDVYQKADGYFNLSWWHINRGSPVEARGLMQQALQLFVKLGHQENIAFCVSRFGFIAAQLEDYCNAIRCLAAGMKLRGVAGTPLKPIQLIDEQEMVSKLRSRLSETHEDFENLWLQGTRWDQRAAINFVLAGYSSASQIVRIEEIDNA